MYDPVCLHFSPALVTPMIPAWLSQKEPYTSQKYGTHHGNFNAWNFLFLGTGSGIDSVRAELEAVLYTSVY